MHRVHFPNLNGLRFVAASMVIVNHIEVTKAQLGIPNLTHFSFVMELGGVGVTMFFTLSGFLITYLLLEEKRFYTTISIKAFYFRRILRVWPLYFLLVLVVLLLLPLFEFFRYPDFDKFLTTNITEKIVLFLLVIPNLAYVLFLPMPFISPTWSIGVEEQFYLVWPLVINWTSKYLQVLLFIAITSFLLSLGLVGEAIERFNRILEFWSTEKANQIAHYINDFFRLFRIGCMAIGGIGAFLVMNRLDEIRDIFFSRPTQVYVVLIVCTCLMFSLKVSHEFYSIIFMVLMLNLSSNSNSIIRLNSRLFDYLGRISYGLYMFHSIAVYVVIKLFIRLGFLTIGVLPNLALYFSIFFLTILISHVGYQYFEKRFLKMKTKFEMIASS